MHVVVSLCMCCFTHKPLLCPKIYVQICVEFTKLSLLAVLLVFFSGLKVSNGGIYGMGKLILILLCNQVCVGGSDVISQKSHCMIIDDSTVLMD